jgi:hypothetical protein
MTPSDVAALARALMPLIAPTVREAVLEGLRQAKLQEARDRLTPAERELVDAAGVALGTGCCLSDEVATAAQSLDIGEARARLHAAVRGVLGDKDPTPTAIGTALGSIARRGGTGNAWRVARPKDEHGAAVWAFELVGSLGEA